MLASSWILVLSHLLRHTPWDCRRLYGDLLIVGSGSDAHWQLVNNKNPADDHVAFLILLPSPGFVF